jgi:predicted ATP-binding protein involved in virulence
MISNIRFFNPFLKNILNILDLAFNNFENKSNVANFHTQKFLALLKDEKYDETIFDYFLLILSSEILALNGDFDVSFSEMLDNKVYYLDKYLFNITKEYEKVDYKVRLDINLLEIIQSANDNFTTINDILLFEAKNAMYSSYDWLKNLYEYKNQEEKQQFSSPILLFALKYFSISNFQCIKHIEAQLPIDAQFIVFTGENGDGKTSILQALSLGFYNTKDLRDNEKGNTETAITVQYKANENSYHNEIYNNPKFPILYSLRNNIEGLKNFAAYGASRLQLESVESADNQKLLRSPIFNLFYSNAILQNIERWLRTRLLKGETERYNSVIELLVKLLPNVTAIEREDTADDVIFVYTEKGIKIPIEHLSSGHKSIVAMIGDMVIRLSSAQPEITNPKDFAGIVLIDELETHLHPKWQKEFPKILSDTFPKVQFIVTTHSAITLLGMPKNTVFFKVTRTEEEGTQIERLEIDVENLTPNLLLSSPIFGLADIFSVQNKGMENVHTGNFYDEKDTRQQAKDKIRSLYKQLKDKENNEKSN